MNPTNRHWYALYLRSRYEKRVDEELKSKRVEVFLPLIEEIHQWRDRKKRVTEPLFRGYIFVHSDLRDRAAILSTEGVVRFVGINCRPSPIPEYQIVWVRKVVGEPIGIRREHFLTVGQRVKVISGPLIGIEGIILRNQGIARVVISVEAIAQSFSVQLPADLLETVCKSKQSKEIVC